MQPLAYVMYVGFMGRRDVAYCIVNISDDGWPQPVALYPQS
jgi:hypothetical protein